MAYRSVHNQIEAAWQAWVDALAGLGEVARQQPDACGEWSVTDLAFHIALWDRQASFDVQFRHDNAGSAPPPRDWQRMNEEDHERQAGRSSDEGLTVMHATHASLMHVVEAHQDDDLGWLVPELVDHYEEHTAQITAWRKEKGL